MTVWIPTEKMLVDWTIWMLEHNFLWLYFGVTMGVMAASFLYVYLKHGPDAFKANPDSDDTAENMEQDRKLAKKMRDMKKGKGGF